MKRAIVICVIVLSCMAGVVVPAANAQTIPPPRYPIIADMVTLQWRVDEQARRIDELEGRIGALTLLRAHDINMAQQLRSEDLKRIYRLELATYGQECPR